MFFFVFFFFGGGGGGIQFFGGGGGGGIQLDIIECSKKKARKSMKSLQTDEKVNHLKI